LLDPGRGRTKTGGLWVYVRDDRPAASSDPPAVWFQYSPDRKGEHPQGHLKSFSGTPCRPTPTAAGASSTRTGRIREAACWAHARRPFWDLHLSLGRAPGTLAEQALLRIAELYKIEADIRGRHPRSGDEQRQARAGPLLKELNAWLRGMLGRVSAKSELAAAIGYSLDALAGADALPGRRPHRDRQQRRRAALRGVSLAARTTCSSVRTREVNVPRRSTAWSRRPSSMGSIRKRTCARCWIASPITRSTASTSCCRGTWRNNGATNRRNAGQHDGAQQRDR
jgi:hypothetical protein